MKRCCFIGWVLLALAACSPVETRHGTSLPTDISPELAAVDSLLWQRPDSALTLLLSCRDAIIASPNTPDGDSSETHSMRLYNGHYYQLLLAELLYKNDSAQANRAELQQAVAYFDSLMAGADAPRASADNATITFLAARAHYINGVGYYENDSLVEACREYLKALETMEERFGEKELVGKKANFMALIYTRLTVLFSDFYLHEQALFFGKEALQYYQKYDATPWHVAWMFNQIGSHYEMMEQFDNSAFYYGKAIDTLNDTCCLLYRDIVSHQAILKYKSGESFETPLSQLKKMLSLSQSENENMARCSSIGEIYYLEKQFDSALIYLNQVFRESQNEELKKQNAELLVDVLKTQGRDMDILEYAEFLVPFANLNENQSYLKSELTELCNEFMQRKQETIHRWKMSETMRKKNFLFTGLALIFIVGFLVYFYRSKSRLKTEMLSHKMQQAALASKLKKSNEALRETTKQLEKAIAEKEISGPALAKDYASFREAPICRQILETVKGNYFKSKMDCSAYKEYALGKEQLQSLRDSADEHMAQFTTRLRKQFPSLNEEDVNYCCLYLLGLNEAEISVLMQRAYPTVCERNRKIRRIIGEKNDLSFALRNF